MTAGTSLVRAITVEVDRSTWKSQPARFRHPYPKVLTQQAGPSSVNLLAMLIHIGELTTPTLTQQSGVAKLWPLLRYLHVMSETPGLRMRQAWEDVDPHQKGVASDDLGVGLGMMVLNQAFDYVACIDGRRFLYRLTQLGMVASVSGLPPKVGTMKMADFAALDPQGKVHLIECKGTQHSRSALNKAIGEGMDQKRSLVCSSPGAERRLIGQRLVVGTHLAMENSQNPTRVLIVDPAPTDEPVELRARTPQPIMAEVAMRLDVARAIGGAGAERTAMVIAQTDRSYDAPALEGPDQRRRAQDAFATDQENLQTFEEYGDYWVGERVVVPLFEPLNGDGTTYRYARLTKAVSKRLMGEIMEAGESSVLFQQQYPATASIMRSAVTLADGERVAVVRKGISLTEIVLLEKRS